jgi:prephenate dehydrogenase
MNDEDGFFTLSKARVSIVGLGLMGASLALDLRGHCAEIIGVGRSASTLDYALEHQMIDRVASFDDALDCDLLVLATPIRTIIEQLGQINASSSALQESPSTVVVDMGSTKAEIVQAMQNLPPRFDPIGGHPMCGKEVAGIQHAEAGLYRNQTFILTLLERTSPGALALVQEMITLIGARPLMLSAEKQDNLVAMISHLPYLASSGLVRSAMAKNDSQLWDVAASGFRDTSRLAASDLTMMLDILLTNREAVLEALKLYRTEMDALTALVESGDEAALRAALTPSQQKRSQMFIKG